MNSNNSEKGSDDGCNSNGYKSTTELDTNEYGSTNGLDMNETNSANGLNKNESDSDKDNNNQYDLYNRLNNNENASVYEGHLSAKGHSMNSNNSERGSDDGCNSYGYNSTTELDTNEHGSTNGLDMNETNSANGLNKNESDSDKDHNNNQYDLYNRLNNNENVSVYESNSNENDSTNGLDINKHILTHGLSKNVHDSNKAHNINQYDLHNRPNYREYHYESNSYGCYSTNEIDKNKSDYSANGLNMDEYSLDDELNKTGDSAKGCNRNQLDLDNAPNNNEYDSVNGRNSNEYHSANELDIIECSSTNRLDMKEYGLANILISNEHDSDKVHKKHGYELPYIPLQKSAKSKSSSHLNNSDQCNVSAGQHESGCEYSTSDADLNSVILPDNTSATTLKDNILEERSLESEYNYNSLKQTEPHRNSEFKDTFLLNNEYSESSSNICSETNAVLGDTLQRADNNHLEKNIPETENSIFDYFDFDCIFPMSPYSTPEETENKNRSLLAPTFEFNSGKNCMSEVMDMDTTDGKMSTTRQLDSEYGFQPGDENTSIACFNSLKSEVILNCPSYNENGKTFFNIFSNQSGFENGFQPEAANELNNFSSRVNSNRPTLGDQEKLFPELPHSPLQKAAHSISSSQLNISDQCNVSAGQHKSGCACSIFDDDFNAVILPNSNVRSECILNNPCEVFETLNSFEKSCLEHANKTLQTTHGNNLKENISETEISSRSLIQYLNTTASEDPTPINSFNSAEKVDAMFLLNCFNEDLYANNEFPKTLFNSVNDSAECIKPNASATTPKDNFLGDIPETEYANCEYFDIKNVSPLNTSPTSENTGLLTPTLECSLKSEVRLNFPSYIENGKPALNVAYNESEFEKEFHAEPARAHILNNFSSIVNSNLPTLGDKERLFPELPHILLQKSANSKSNSNLNNSGQCNVSAGKHESGCHFSISDADLNSTILPDMNASYECFLNTSCEVSNMLDSFDKRCFEQTMQNCLKSPFPIKNSTSKGIESTASATKHKNNFLDERSLDSVNDFNCLKHTEPHRNSEFKDTFLLNNEYSESFSNFCSETNEVLRDTLLKADNINLEENIRQTENPNLKYIDIECISPISPCSRPEETKNKNRGLLASTLEFNSGKNCMSDVLDMDTTDGKISPASEDHTPINSFNRAEKADAMFLLNYFNEDLYTNNEFLKTPFNSVNDSAEHFKPNASASTPKFNFLGDESNLKSVYDLYSVKVKGPPRYSEFKDTSLLYNNYSESVLNFCSDTNEVLGETHEIAHNIHLEGNIPETEYPICEYFYLDSVSPLNTSSTSEEKENSGLLTPTFECSLKSEVSLNFTSYIENVRHSINIAYNESEYENECQSEPLNSRIFNNLSPRVKSKERFFPELPHILLQKSANSKSSFYLNNSGQCNVSTEQHKTGCGCSTSDADFNAVNLPDNNVSAECILNNPCDVSEMLDNFEQSCFEQNVQNFSQAIASILEIKSETEEFVYPRIMINEYESESNLQVSYKDSNLPRKSLESSEENNYLNKSGQCNVSVGKQHKLSKDYILPKDTSAGQHKSICECSSSDALILTDSNREYHVTSQCIVDNPCEVYEISDSCKKNLIEQTIQNLSLSLAEIFEIQSETDNSECPTAKEYVKEPNSQTSSGEGKQMQSYLDPSSIFMNELNNAERSAYLKNATDISSTSTNLSSVNVSKRFERDSFAPNSNKRMKYSEPSASINNTNYVNSYAEISVYQDSLTQYSDPTVRSMSTIQISSDKVCPPLNLDCSVNLVKTVSMSTDLANAEQTNDLQHSLNPKVGNIVENNQSYNFSKSTNINIFEDKTKTSETTSEHILNGTADIYTSGNSSACSNSNRKYYFINKTRKPMYNRKAISNRYRKNWWSPNAKVSVSAKKQQTSNSTSERNIATKKKLRKPKKCNMGRIRFRAKQTEKKEKEISMPITKDNEPKCYVCPYAGCDRKHKFKSLVIRHMHSHTGDKPFACSFCEKPYRRQESCMNHVLRVHEKVKVSTRSMRQYVTYVKPHLELQNAISREQINPGLDEGGSTVIDEDGQTCFFCDKTFLNLSDLEKHLVTHLDENPQ